jgi:hypothetical protein
LLWRQALGWRISGIEMDDAAAAIARRFTDEIYIGDILAAPFASGRFDVVTASTSSSTFRIRGRSRAACWSGWRRAGF